MNKSNYEWPLRILPWRQSTSESWHGAGLFYLFLFITTFQSTQVVDLSAVALMRVSWLMPMFYGSFCPTDLYNITISYFITFDSNQLTILIQGNSKWNITRLLKTTLLLTSNGNFILILNITFIWSLLLKLSYYRYIILLSLISLLSLFLPSLLPLNTIFFLTFLFYISIKDPCRECNLEVKNDDESI